MRFDASAQLENGNWRFPETIFVCDALILFVHIFLLIFVFTCDEHCFFFCWPVDCSLFVIVNHERVPINYGIFSPRQFFYHKSLDVFRTSSHLFLVCSNLFSSPFISIDFSNVLRLILEFVFIASVFLLLLCVYLKSLLYFSFDRVSLWFSFHRCCQYNSLMIFGFSSEYIHDIVYDWQYRHLTTRKVLV